MTKILQKLQVFIKKKFGFVYLTLYDQGFCKKSTPFSLTKAECFKGISLPRR